MKSKGYRGPYLFGLGLAVALLLGLGVGGWGLLGTTIASAADDPIKTMRALPAGIFIEPPLNPRIPDANLSGDAATVASIEIDDRDNDPDTAGVKDEINANYSHTGTHAGTAHNVDSCPVSGSATNDQDCPNTTVDAYGDWNDIVPGPADVTPGVKGNHKVVDSIGNSDQSIFSPDSCMTDGSALGKQDITEIYLANNSEYFYFGQARRENNGNSQFYWVFSENEPQATSGACSGGKDRLDMEFSEGDVRVRIGFPSSPNSSQPLVSDLSFHKYISGTSTGLIEAADAVNDVLNNPLRWDDTTDEAVKNYSLNTSCISAPSSGTNSALGAANKCGTANLVDYVEFAEGAIDLEELLGGSICGKTLYLTVITRPSESATSDLKDFLGPIKIDFGGVTANAAITGSCSLSLTYTGAGSVDNSGAEIVANSAFNWEFFLCNDGCDIDTDDNGTLDQVVVTADTSVGTVKGNKASPPPFAVAVSGTYQAVLKVIDPGSPGCFDYDTSNSAETYGPITVGIVPDAIGLSCQAVDTAGTDVSYTANPSGGKPPYSYTWNVTGDNTAAGCPTTSASCLVDSAPSNYCALIGISVTVDDSFAACLPVTSESETVTKTTDVVATNN